MLNPSTALPGQEMIVPYWSALAQTSPSARMIRPATLWRPCFPRARR